MNCSCKLFKIFRCKKLFLFRLDSDLFKKVSICPWSLVRLSSSRDSYKVINTTCTPVARLFPSVTSAGRFSARFCDLDRFSTMPESSHQYLNGHQNGHLETENENFLFTSESVGEGHPG